MNRFSIMLCLFSAIILACILVIVRVEAKIVERNKKAQELANLSLLPEWEHWEGTGQEYLERLQANHA